MTDLRLTEHARANMRQRVIPSAVVATTGEVITVGHRDRRIPRH